MTTPELGFTVNTLNGLLDQFQKGMYQDIYEDTFALMRANYQLLDMDTLPLLQQKGFDLSDFFNNFYLHLGGDSFREEFELQGQEVVDSTPREIGERFGLENTQNESDLYLGLKQSEFYQRIDDTIEAVGLSKTFSKENFENNRQALARFFQGKEMKPDDQEIVQGMLACYKYLRDQGFNHSDLTA